MNTWTLILKLISTTGLLDKLSEYACTGTLHAMSLLPSNRKETECKGKRFSAKLICRDGNAKSTETI